MSVVSEITILGRLLDASGSPMSQEMARGILALGFTAADRRRMDELGEKARAGTLTPEERADAESYERAANVLSTLKSKARMALRDAAGAESQR